ncbi:M23 family metallopeptidase [Hirschia litorea]|uniref:M23 family metallopeptidase n=1 Tax=Hirschia litorea TaxID=1199156 RepID=A0ABW2IIY9_9PROT
MTDLKSLSIIASVAAFSFALACAPVSDADVAQPPTESAAQDTPAQHVDGATQTVENDADAPSALEQSYVPAPVVEEVFLPPDGEEDAISVPAVEDVQAQCSPSAKQGGLIVCKLPVGAVVKLDGKEVAIVDESQIATIGLKQDASTPAKISWSQNGISHAGFEIPVSPRKDDYRELTGLDCDKVDARSEEQKAHASRSWVKKVAAFANLNAPTTHEIAFLKPADGPYSSPFGPTRKYTGVSKVTGEACNSTSVHRGLDMAVPVGTDLIAPMGGTVVLADPDLYYEGGTIFLDHGYGLVSVFLHLSQVDVQAGQVVKTGERMGATGNTGRTTGPHLHWAVKWRNTAREDRDGDFYIDPAIVLELGDLDLN